MQQQRRLAAVIVPAFLLVALMPGPAAEAVSLRQLKQRWISTARSISALQARLHRTKQKQAAAEQDLQYAKHRLDITKRNLNDIRTQLGETKTRLAVTMDKLHVIQSRLHARSQLLGERLVDSYKYGNVSYAGVVFGAGDFWDLLNGAHIVRKIVDKDADLIEAIKQDKRAIEEHKAILEEQKRKRSELEQQQTSLTRQASSQTVECRQILKSIEQQRAELDAQLAADRAASSQISAMIRRMQATPQGRRRLATPWHGSFTMPVYGRITSAFGMRYHPILHSRRMHTGTDIAAAYGTPIHAAASGVVVLAGWYGAYGNTVVLDHGGGVITFYGHASRLAVHTGQSVKRGQVVSYVGSTGLSTGPHVHFEVQKNGRPVSPYGSF